MSPHGPALDLAFHGLDEPAPGAGWRRLWGATHGSYQRWWLEEGDARRPGYAAARRALGEHMPELLPTWQRLVELAGGGDLAARMLALWCPPPFIRGCSQAARSGPRPVLVRNYDYDPRRFEATVSRAAYGGRLAVGTSDCLWGLLDGVNEDGLAVSLAFGGLPDEAPGFAIPLVLRYLLATCSTSAEAAAVLARVPVNMAYNVTTVDRFGVALTTAIAPGVPARTRPSLVATNHQDDLPLWEEHATASRTHERADHLGALVHDERVGEEDLVAAFMAPPLRARAFHAGFGTLYTAVMRPGDGHVEYRWPDQAWQVPIVGPLPVAPRVRLAA